MYLDFSLTHYAGYSSCILMVVRRSAFLCTVQVVTRPVKVIIYFTSAYSDFEIFDRYVYQQQVSRIHHQNYQEA